MPRDKQRLYAKFERATWRNPTFRNTLSDDARWLWMHLLTTPRTTKCPGLIDASVAMIAEDIGWDTRGVDGPPDIIKGIERTTKAMDELAATTRKSDGMPWLKYSAADRLVFLTRGVAHNLPANANVVSSWVRDLDEYPDCEIKKEWAATAFRSLQSAFGKSDRRVSIAKSIYYHLAQHQVSLPGPFDEQLPAAIEEDGTVASTPHALLQPDGRNSCVPSNSNSNKSSSKRPHSASLEKPNPASFFSEEDSENPPADFTRRQRAFFEALKKTEFYVRGRGAMTAFHAVKDPIRLARNLGEHDTYPAVDAGLIGRLGGWTFLNKNRAKVDIGKFILNRARATQERGGDQHRGGAPESGAAAMYGDLEGKTR